MAFSLRSFFSKGGSGSATTAAPLEPAQKLPPNNDPPKDGTSDPPFASSLLFKTTSPGVPLGQPVAQGPFAPAGNSLTAGDLLPGIPQDVAKNPAPPADLPVVISDRVIESALRSGRASLPIFEVFSACPELFQQPVGPHDPREIPLPPQKIGLLLHGRNGGPPPLPAPVGLADPPREPAAASPFSLVSPPPGGTPATPQPPAASFFHPSPFGAPPLFEAAGSSAAQDRASALPPSPPLTFSSSPGSPFAPAATPSSPFAPAAFPPPLSHAAGSPPASPLPPIPAMTAQPGSSPAANSPPSDFIMAQPYSPPSSGAPEPAFGGASFLPPSQKPPDSPPATSASWASLFPSSSFQNHPHPSHADPLPGVGATLFPPAPAAPSSTPLPGSAGDFPAAPAKPFNPFERIQALAKNGPAESASLPSVSGSAGAPAPAPAPAVENPSPKSPELVSNFGASPLPPPPPPPLPDPAPVVFTPPAAPLPEAPAVSGCKVIKLGLASSLKNCPAHDLGTNPDNIPSWVQFSLPYDLLADQLPTGRVTVALDAIVGGLDAPVRALFAQARAGLQVELPANDVFHAISDGAPTASAAPAAPAPPASVTPPASVPAPVPVPDPKPSSAAMDPFAPLLDSGWKELAPPSTPFMSEPPASSVAIPPAIFGSQAFPSPPPLRSEPRPAIPAPAFQSQPKPEPVVIPANPATGAPEFVTPPPVAPAQAQGSLAAVATPRADNQTRRLLLTVLLGSPEAETAADIVRLTRALPGVSAALCVQDENIVAQATDGSSEAERFLRDAPANIRVLPALTALTGISDTETLHIRSGAGEATFSLQGRVTFAVLHDPRRREPALMEKITLLARELSGMLRDTPSF